MSATSGWRAGCDDGFGDVLACLDRLVLLWSRYPVCMGHQLASGLKILPGVDTGELGGPLVLLNGGIGLFSRGCMFLDIALNCRPDLVDGR